MTDGLVLIWISFTSLLILSKRILKRPLSSFFSIKLKVVSLFQSRFLFLSRKEIELRLENSYIPFTNFKDADLKWSYQQIWLISLSWQQKVLQSWKCNLRGNQLSWFKRKQLLTLIEFNEELPRRGLETRKSWGCDVCVKEVRQSFMTGWRFCHLCDVTMPSRWKVCVHQSSTSNNFNNWHGEFSV